MAFNSTYRALLTETLPYEVPVIFSNETLFASLSAKNVPGDLSILISKLRGKVHKFTIPYTYSIVKDTEKTTALSIVHPNYQLTMSDFYDHYRQSMLDFCSRSPATLRRPVEEVSIFTANELQKDKTLKTGIPHIDPAEGEIEAAHVSSYFAYGKYNLLGKFVDSVEYRSLEKRFGLMRMLDISKCFFHIYTHSVTWAAKGKSFAKAHGDTYSFEGRFDRLMQGANYNETNGIVVGPEISRIFAEIILQDVDLKLISELKQYTYDQDYSIRRYVDDYFIFSSSEEVLNNVQSKLSEVLENYKLFINPHKTVTTKRPFVSSITIARSDIASIISDMHRSLDDLRGQQDLSLIRKKVREIRRQSLDIRLVCERHGISFSNVSGWLLATLRVLVRRSIAALQVGNSDDAIQALSEVTSALLDVAFYICALDMRVRATYSLCQIITSLTELKAANLTEVKDRLFHLAATELCGMIEAILPRRGNAESVELYNLMIIGAHLLGEDFLRTPACQSAIENLMASSRISYFQFISVKFCLLKDVVGSASKLLDLNERVAQQILDSRLQLSKDAETYLLMADYLSSPDVPDSAKRILLSGLVGGQPSNHLVTLAGRHLGFADWSGLRIQHVLARKELRPVYSWA